MDNPDATAEPAEEPGADPPDTEHRLKRIETLTQTARATWFGYLGAVVFAGITLLGVEDKDFFSFDSSTQLPLVNVSVPVTSFFWAGGGLLAILYGYLHVFLEKLWRELGAIPARHRGLPISESVHPWIVSDYALRRRRRLRPAEQATETEPVIWTPLGVVGALASFLLCWLSGPAIAAAFWYRSMPAHEWPMTVFLGVLLAATVATCLASLATLNRHVGLRSADDPPKRRSPLNPANLAWAWWRAVTLYSDERLARQRRHIGRYRDFALFAVLAVLLTPVSVMRTEWDWHDSGKVATALYEGLDGVEKREQEKGLRHRIQYWFRPVPANLSDVSLSQIPSDWDNYQSAMQEFFNNWCEDNRKESICISKHNDLRNAKFSEAWPAHRSTYLRSIRKPNLRYHNLSRGRMARAHLPGVDLRSANIEGAYLAGAQMEAVMLWGAILKGSTLTRAQMSSAILSEAHLDRASLSYSVMMDVVLFGAKMDGVKIRDVDLKRSDLSFTRIIGSSSDYVDFGASDLSLSVNHGGALRFVDLSRANIDDGTDFRNSFGDSTVILPIGMKRPCQWVTENDENIDSHYWGRWRGWLLLRPNIPPWAYFAPPGFEDVPPIPPPEGCVWKTDPLPAAE